MKIIAILVSSMFYMLGITCRCLSRPSPNVYSKSSKAREPQHLTLESKDETEKRIFEVKAFKWDAKRQRPKCTGA